MFAALVLDINLRETPPSGVLPPRRHKLRLQVSSGPGETYTHQNSGCSTTSSTSTGTMWRDFFQDFHDNNTVLLMDIDAAEQVGDLIADRTFSDSQTGGNSTENETTDVQLWHKPQTP
jgi:hypothetical protein